ncbi:hypothetical protein vseg_004197 [Gypsophila vaccaria]
MSKFIPNRVFEDYDPPTDLVTEEGCDTLLIYLPGFKKEQLKVQLTISRVLKISGERPIGDNRYRRFQKEFRVPPNCDTKEITAKFEGGILYIRQPKLITPDAATPAQQPQKAPTQAPRPQQPPPPQPQVSVPPPLPLPQPQSQQRAPPPPPSPPQLQSQQRPPLLPPSPLYPQSQKHSPPTPPQLQSQKHAPPAPPPPPPQPQPQTRAPPTPPPSPPKLQPQQEAAAKSREEETRAEKKDKQAMGSKDETGRDESEVIQQSRQVVNSGLFRELRKPDNLKRLGVSVLLVLIIAFYISYMFKSFMGNGQDIVSEYYPEL